MKLLVSACLLGVCCRYDGASRPDDRVMALLGRHELFPVCPEQLGGLPTPRCPCERQGERVVSREGEDRTAAYQKGAQETLRLCRLLSCQAAVLKARSPSCGAGQIYDGTFSGVLTAGDGVAAELLIRRGIPVYTETALPDEWFSAESGF